jgi:hypothetical protein
MYSHKNFLTLIICTWLIFQCGCATTYAPGDWLPDTDEITEEAYGGWMTIVTLPDTINSEERWLQYGGEFIAVDTLNVYQLYDSLFIIPKSNIYKTTLEIDQKNSVAYGLWTFGGFVATLSNGFYLIFTAPIWLITGIPASVGESLRDRYEAEFPDSLYWTEVRKFARFPQGLPENFDLKNLKPKVIVSE